jgi:methylated-DNA-[protein]-cysteine S-methyltransferase
MLRDGPCSPLVESDWNPALRSRLQQFAVGEPVEFDDVSTEDSFRTGFQRRVVAATRCIRYGNTLTYGELASRAGSPHAARAVGQVMSSNPLPIIIPCHRVIAANGRPGGFSAPAGVRLKQRMLDLEAGRGARPQHDHRRLSFSRS